MSKTYAKNIAVIGCGQWGKNLVRNMAGLGALAAVGDISSGTARKYADEFGVLAADPDMLVRDPAIAGVVIATPAETHARFALAALDAGKHVYVEKPMSLTVADGEATVARARQAGRILMVGHLLQYHPAFLAVRDMLNDGVLGSLRYIYSNRLNLGKVRREENVFWSFAPHDISMILSLAGALPTRINTKGSYYLNKDIADVTTTDFEFANGINGHIFVSWLHPFKEQKLVVVGEKAMLVFDDCADWSTKVTLYRHTFGARDGQPIVKAAAGEPIPLPASEPLRLECEHFLECIADGKRPRTDGEEGLRVLKVLAAAETSMRTGREVQL